MASQCNSKILVAFINITDYTVLYKMKYWWGVNIGGLTRITHIYNAPFSFILSMLNDMSLINQLIKLSNKTPTNIS